MRIWRIMILSLMMLGLLLPWGGLGAQNDEPEPLLGVLHLLQDGETIQDSLSPRISMHLYAFSAAQNASVSISLTATNGALDPFLLLLDSSGQVIGADDDSGEGLNALLNVTALDEGLYLLLVSSRFALYSDGLATEELISGEYELSISGISSPAEDSLDMTNFDLPQSFLEVPSEGELSAEQPAYLTWLLIRDSALVTLNAESDEVDTLLYVFNPDGERIAVDDDGGSGTNAAIQALPLDDPGVYLIVVTTYDLHNVPRWGLEGGAFSLRLTRAN